MKINDKKKITEELIDTFVETGKITLDLRAKGLKKEIKDDSTPVTNADLEINNILIKKIKELTPDIPIVSEESSKNKNSNNLNNFWLIDPIDGTHDYINNKDEFTINAALVIKNVPEIGVINAPAKKRLFYTYDKNFSFEIYNQKQIKLDCTKKTGKGQINAVSYSNNLKPIISELHKKLKVTKHVKMKSSLKFCVIATGEYDLYVAEARASEWDIAAGHAILKNAGGIITDFQGNEIKYGKKDFKNTSLILKRAEIL
tara:strand:- start:256 stop:1029 length:774 start_codon:yes stop_codon:yes gene_type:complete